MNLNDNQIAKIDPLLEEVLMRARGDEVIRTIVSLGAENQIKKDASHPPLEPKQFSSNEAYRQALIDRRKSQVTEEVGGTIQALQNLSLKTLGEGLSRVVVVEGSADAIVRSLELPGVNHVTLDQLIALPEIAPEQAVKHFADLYIKTLDRPLDRKTTKLISQASQQYIINYYKRHNKLQILGMQKPVDLDSIYTAVQCLPPSDIGQFESVEALQELFRQAGRGFQPRKTDKQDGIAIANQQQYLMVLGAPGAGKSTFLRKIGLEALKGKGNQSEFPHECIPVFIELKQFTAEINIEETIREEFRLCQLPFAEEFTTKALQQGKLLILLDGLDEVPTNNMDLAIRQIQYFVDKYHKNRLIASCRTAAYRRNFRQFMEVAIADFDDNQIHTFIQNWFSSEVDRKVGTAEKCWKLINTQESTKELARTPLLLTFLCLVYDASQDLPKKLAPLYSKALDILLEKWAAEKRLSGDHISRDLGIDLEKIMLSEIAYRGFEADSLFLSRQEVVSQIKEFIASNDNAPNHLETEAILDAIAIQQGILVERARNVYSFSHLTLQEYLTAKYIEDYRQIEKLVAEHLTDKRWQEVFLLVSGLMQGGADELLLLMEKQAQKYIKNRKLSLLGITKLQALLDWAKRVTAGSKGDFKPGAKRAVAIAIAYAIPNAYSYINAYADAYAIPNAYAIANSIPYTNATADANTIANSFGIADANTITNTITIAIAIAIANAKAIANAFTIAYPDANANTLAITNVIAKVVELEKLKIFNNVNFTSLIARLEALKGQVPDHQEPFVVRQKFFERLEQTLLNTFKLSPEMVDLSEEEVKALENYLYTNSLLVQCKQAAVRVSSKTWEAIEERMLLVPGD